MNIDRLFDRLLVERVLFIDPSPELMAASAALEQSPMGAAPRFDQLRTPEAWAEFRGAVMPFSPYIQEWNARGAALAREVEIDGPGGKLVVRIVAPQDGRVRGGLFHTLGGGWIANTPASFDYKHAQAAELCGLVVACVDWRKAPEHPYPAQLDDMEAACLWFIDFMREEYAQDRMFLRGESSGGNTGAATMLRMKRKHGFVFDGAVLDIGCFDLSGSLPSHRENDHRNQGMDSVSVDQLADLYLQGGEDRRDPDVSPMYGDLAGLCPALFTCGDLDVLRDGAFLMHMRWLAAGNESWLVDFRGIGHVMALMDCPEVEMEALFATRFLDRLIAG